MPLDTVDFSCDLPVVSQVDHSTPEGTGGDGFLSLPGRELRQNPALAEPYYDRAVNQWLPVGPWAVSPDGRRFAALEWGTEATATAARVPTRLLLYDAARNAVLRVVTMPGAIEYEIIDFSATGIELYVAGPGMGLPLPGVWNVNPDTGVVTKVSDAYDPPSARWIRDSSGRILHRDAAGHTTTWLDLRGETPGFVPFAGDSALLVGVIHSNLLADLWLVHGPGDATKLVTGAAPESADWELALELSPMDSGPYFNYSFFIVDQHGVWLAFWNGSAAGGLYLVTLAGAILHVDNRAVYPAGACA